MGLFVSRLRWAALVFLSCLALTACSEEAEVDKCAGVVCDRGVCEAGACKNASSCSADNVCLAGYRCAVNSQCVADEPCVGEGRGSCSRGMCVQGACVASMDGCQDASDCAQGQWCHPERRQCEQEPCSSGAVSCPRGVCDPLAGACVNAASCTEDDELTSCLLGFKCGATNTCLDEAGFCAQLACPRGECNFQLKTCVNALDCAGDDRLCLPGRFCDQGDECQVNACDAQQVMCARGVCDRSSAQCINPATCSAQVRCLDGFLCVSGACVEPDQACGAEGCAGNQRCAYNEASLSAACEESEAGCTDSLDCLNDRVCRQRRCQPPGLCQPDLYEPNDTQAAPMPSAGVVDATLCVGDVDRFVFDTNTSSLTQGTLLVELAVARQDVGIGAASLIVKAPDGREVARVPIDATGRARALTPVTIVQRGAFELRVEGQVREPGLSYRLRAQVVDNAAINACQMPYVLGAGTSMQRSTTSGRSSALRASCVDQEGLIPEDVWMLTLDRASYVTITARPQAGVNLGLSVRSDCLNAGGDEVCAERAGAGANEVISTTLPPGDHFVIVQATSPTSGGLYALDVNIIEAICTSADNTCRDADFLSQCNMLGTAIFDTFCDLGCDATTSRCRRTPGDTCADAIELTPGVPYTGQVDWSALADELRMPAGACLPASSGIIPVDGPDMIFTADVPPGYALFAELQDRGANVSMYIVTNCAQLANTCLVGANQWSSTAESLSWRNDGQQSQRVFLVADVRSSSSYLPSNISIQFLPTICSPNVRACDETGLLTRLCNAQGTDFASISSCSAGCNAMTGRCNTPPENTCAGAVEAISGVPITGVIDDFTSNYPLTSAQSCTGFSVSGPEAVYKLSNVQQGERISVVYTTSFDGSLWLTNMCSPTSGAGACLIGSDRAGTTTPESFVYTAPAAGDYFVMAAAYSSSGRGNYTLVVDRQLPDCQLGDQSDCDGNSVVYCDAANFTARLNCPTTCTAGQCDQRDGDTCFSAIELMGTQGTVAGSFGGATNSLTLPVGISGGCVVRTGQASAGPDRVYAIDLNIGDLLTAQLTTTLSTAHMYILESCRDLSTCVVNNPERGNATLRYHADTTRRVYIVVSASGASTTSFSLSYTVSQGSSCAPNGRRCINADTAGLCDATGLIESYVSCAAGCSGGACVDEVALTNTCTLQAPDVGDGISVLGSFGAHTSSVNLSQGACVGATTPGAELFYQVTLNPGQGVEARARSFATDNPVLYIFTDCNAPAGSCLRGARRATGTQQVETFYVNTTLSPQRVFIALDSELSSAAQPFLLTIERYASSCMPGSPQCVGLANGGEGSQVCRASGAGYGDATACAAGCNPSTGLCFAAPGERCDAAIELVAGVPQVGNIPDFPLGTSGSCPKQGGGTVTSNGRRAIYRVSGATQGETLRVTVGSPESRDMVVWIASSCDASGALGACLLAADSQFSSTQPEVINYQAPADGDYYVIAHVFSSSVTTGTFTVNLQRLVPICMAGTSRCTMTMSGQEAREVCAADGLSYGAPQVCSAGCDVGSGLCNVPPGDRCDNPVELTLGVPFTGAVADYTSQHPKPSGCTSTFSFSGRDVVGRVANVAVGQRIRFTYTGMTFDSAIYISDSCVNGQIGTCLGGSDVTGTGPETFTYTATAAGDLYVVGGPWNSTTGASGTFTLLAEDVTP